MTTKTYTAPEVLEKLLTEVLEYEIVNLQEHQAIGHDFSVAHAGGRISGIVGALYFLTHEDHAVIQARAEQAVADQTNQGETK